MTTFDHYDTEEIEQLLLGHSVVKVTSTMLQLDDGTILDFVGNDGCPGCGNGQYDLTELNGVDNIITDVQLFNDADDTDGRYTIFVYADNVKINLATFEGGDGNGYYGTGYTITVQRPS